MQHRCVAVLRCALWKMIYGICDQRKSIEELFDGRWHVKNATRCRLLRPPSFRHFYVGIVLRHHRLQGLVKDIWCLCRKSRPRKSCGRVHLPFFSRQSSTSSSTSLLQPSFLPPSPPIFIQQHLSQALNFLKNYSNAVQAL